MTYGQFNTSTSKQYRIPKMKDVVIQKKRAGIPMTYSQQQFWNKLIVDESKRLGKARKVNRQKWFRFINLARLTNDDYWAEEGEIVG